MNTLIVWGALLAIALLATLTYIAATVAERLARLAGELDALNAEIARTATLVSQIVPGIPPASVQAAADNLKATNDTLQSKITP